MSDISDWSDWSDVSDVVGEVALVEGVGNGEAHQPIAGGEAEHERGRVARHRSQARRIKR